MHKAYQGISSLIGFSFLQKNFLKNQAHFGFLMSGYGQADVQHPQICQKEVNK
jgi:hypothetical protein